MTCPHCGNDMTGITPTPYKGEDLCSLKCYRAAVTKAEPETAAFINNLFGRKS